MIDHLILPAQHRILTPLARQITKLGITADQVTLGAFALGVIAFGLIASGFYLLGLVFIFLNRLGDGLDGIVARATRTTHRGAYFDIACDFVFYALIPLGFAISNAANALPAAFLLCSFVGTCSAFLAFAIIAQKQGLESLNFPSKGIYYLGGLTEGFETISAFVLMCLFPNYFPIIAYIFSAACLVTTFMRWHYAWQMLDGEIK